MENEDKASIGLINKCKERQGIGKVAYKKQIGQMRCYKHGRLMQTGCLGQMIEIS